MIAVFGGKDASPERAVRKGAKKGEVIVDLGDLVAKVRFTAAGGRELIVEDKEGHKLPSPQAVMDRLTGKVGFDAEDFIRKPAPEQLSILRRIVGIDFKDIDEKKKGLFDQRTLVNAEVRRLEAQIAAAPNPTDAPAELVDTMELHMKVTQAHEHNNEVNPLQRTVEGCERNLQGCDEDIGTCMDDVDSIKIEIEAAEKKLAALKVELPKAEQSLEQSNKNRVTFVTELEAAKAKVAAFVHVDVKPILEKIAGADAANTKHRQAEARKALAVTLAGQQRNAQALTNRIDECDAEKERLMQEAKFPVKGLAFTEDGILFDGLPFAQASSSTKRRVSVAIGAALNPTLRVMVIKDGSLIDEKSMAQLRELAAEHNLQVWIEVVTGGPDARCAVIIEDGCVQGAPVVEEALEPTITRKGEDIVDPEAPKDLFSDLPNL